MHKDRISVRGLLPAARALALAVGLSGATPAALAAGDALAGDLTIDCVYATPARAGETARLMLRVENAGAERAVITGLRLRSGEPTRLMGAIGAGGRVPLSDLPVEPDEAVSLDGRTLWIELGPLKADLAADTMVPARLKLDGYEVPITVRVRPADPDHTGAIGTGPAISCS